MQNLKFQDKFVIRTPLFPLNKITDFDLQWKAMDEKLEDSLFLASPDLLKEINRLDSKNKKDNSDQYKIKLSCYKYWTRAHMRCTPYGLFAGCHIGKWGNNTNIIVPLADSIIRNTNLDMNFLCTLGKHLESHPDIKNQIKYYPNTSIYSSNNKIRYIYYAYDERNNRKHQLNAVEVNEYVNRILEKAKLGAQINKLANTLVDEDITTEDASDFVDQFVQAQLLVSELEVAIAGPNYIDQILSTLKALNNQTAYITNTIQILNNIKKHLENLDKGLFNRKEKYFEVVKIIEQLELPYNLSKLFQTDSYKKALSFLL